MVASGRSHDVLPVKKKFLNDFRARPGLMLSAWGRKMADLPNLLPVVLLNPIKILGDRKREITIEEIFLLLQLVINHLVSRN